MIVFSDILTAHRRIKHLIRETPLQYSQALSMAGVTDVLLKLENQQETGSFKVRGATSAISALTGEQKEKGVLAVSSGNHGQGVAKAAKALNIPATILVPQGTPEPKTEAIVHWGANLVVTGGTFDETEEQAQEYLRKTGMTFIHPCCDPWVMAGQGTVGLEVIAQEPELNTLVCPVGGWRSHIRPGFGC